MPPDGLASAESLQEGQHHGSVIVVKKQNATEAIDVATDQMGFR
jgi:hypothetical protein